MKTLVKALILLFLSAVIFGTSGFFIYQLFIRPQRVEKQELAEGTPAPPPDPGGPELERCERLEMEGSLIEARTALQNFVANYGGSAKMAEAKDHLGRINTAIFFSTYPSPEKQEYSVQKGDVLMKIASKMKTTPELIMRSNNMTGPILRIGQRILVSHPNFSLVINRKEKTVTLLDGGKFFKEYGVLEWKAPPARGSSPLTGRVREKMAWKNGQQIGLGARDYGSSARWISVGVPNYTLYSQDTEDEKNPKPAGGIELARSDMAELSSLLNKNVPVTIE